MAKKKYNSFSLDTRSTIMRVVLLSIFAGVAGVVLGSVVLLFVM